jgi:tripartite-type tricarboxylate transporter receptor subunit TctC
MSAELAKIVNLPDTREKLINQGMEPFVLTPDQVTALIKADVAKYAKIVKTADIRVEQ